MQIPFDGTIETTRLQNCGLRIGKANSIAQGKAPTCCSELSVLAQWQVKHRASVRYKLASHESHLIHTTAYRPYNHEDTVEGV